MTDISLRDYLAKLNTLLEREASSEVLYHARHILQYFPKNVAAYRYLGLALLNNGSIDEAVDVLRRVLSVYPDDFTAHLNLGHAYYRARRLNEALWHYERAFERDPNNQPLMENLRRLYREHRGVEHAKIQLTSAAVARQYYRNGLFTQAIDALKAALARSPERPDLLLMLANTLWEAKRPVEAAEIALEVLRKLPDAVDANRILAELWLTEERPSDAQRYLSRIEAVEPYLAASLARGAQVPKEMFHLDELDYQRVATRAATQQNPDWLSSLGAEQDLFGAPTAEDDSLLDFADASDDNFGDPFGEDDLVTAPPDDWLTALEGLQEEAQSETKMVARDAILGTSSADDFDDLFGTSPSPAPAASDDLFNFDFDTASAEDDPLVPADIPDDWLSGIEIDDPSAPTAAPTSSGFTDFLKQTDLGASAPAAAADDTFDDLDWLSSGDALPSDDRVLPAEDAADPMAWLQGTGVELMDEEADDFITPQPRGPRSTDELVAASDAADPLAWLRDHEVEIVEDAPVRRAATLFETDEPLTLADPSEADPLAWLRGSDVEITEDGSASRAGGLFDSAPLPPLPTREAAAEDDDDAGDPMAWLQGYDVEVQDSPKPPVGRFTTDTFGMASDAPQTDDLAWLADDALLDEMLNIEQLSETGELGSKRFAPQAGLDRPDDLFAAPADRSDDTAEMLDWQDTMPQDRNTQPDWLEQPSGQNNFDWLDDDDEQTSATQGQATFDWLADAPPSQSAVQQTATLSLEPEDDEQDAQLDWMSGVGEPESPNAAANDFNWLDETEKDADDALASSSPDWLADVGVSQPATAQTAGSDLEWLQGEDVAQETPVLGAAPDWLSEIGAPGMPTVPEDEQPLSSGLFAETDDWLSSLDELPAADAVGAEWLGGLEDGEQTTEVLGASAANEDWLAAEEDDEPLAAAELPAEIAALRPTDDWLSSLEEDYETAELGDYETTPVADWLSEIGADEEEADIDDLQPALASNEADWLSGLGVDDEEEADIDDLQPALASNEADWLSGLGVDDEEEADIDDLQPALASNEADWLSGLGVDDEEEADIGDLQPALASNEVDWLSGLGVDDDEEEAFQPTLSDMTDDWLSSIGAEAIDPDDEQRPTYAAGTDWLTSAEEEEAVGRLDTGWLSDLRGEQPAQPQPQQDWLSKFDDTPATSQPDWLAELGEDQDATLQPEALSTAADDDDDWLSDFTLEASPDPTTPVPQAATAAELPDWLAELQGAAAEDDAGAWDEDAEEEEAFAAAVPAEADWLSGIGLPESDEEDLLPEETSAQYDWLDEVGADRSQRAVAQPSTMSDFDADDPMQLSDEFDEELELTSAGNAPDWLNAMVPGLDMDYQAPEDEPIEREYVEEAPAYRARTAASAVPVRSFEWLNQIVAEETRVSESDRPSFRPPATAPEATPVPTSAPARRRFTFSRLPVWLRGASESPAPAASAVAASAMNTAVFDDDLPDWLSESEELLEDTSLPDDSDLPEWMK